MRLTAKQTGLIILAIAAIGLALLAYSYFIEPSRLVLNEQTILIDGWEPQFEGFKAVVISDIHAGLHGSDRQHLLRMVDLANAQDADAVFLVGDLVAAATTDDQMYLPMPIEELAGILSGLKAKNGVYAVLGNHEGWFNRKIAADTLKAAGINVLQDEVAFIERGGQRIRILGFQDHLQFGDLNDITARGKKLLAPSERTGDVIVLEHSPDVVPLITGERLISDDLRLILAGHTHGGQVWLPIIGAPIIPSRYGQKYAAGHVIENGVNVFITTGIGTTNLPIRFMVPPEVAVLTLRRK